MHSVKASAPGNLFFAGEHAVVYGHPGIITAIGKRTYCTASERNDNKIIIDSKEYGQASGVLKKGKVVSRKGKEPLMPLMNLIEIVAGKKELTKGFELKIESEIAVESGMSSSTAVLSAMLTSINKLFDLGIKFEEYFEYLYPIQVEIHGGKASGSEIISSSIGGYHRIQKVEKEGKAKLTWKSLGEHEFSVVIGNTLVKAPTMLTVKHHVPSLMKRFPGMVEQAFERIAVICDKMEKALAEEDEELLGVLMNENQRLLAELGISHPKLDDCIKEALKAGALGAKLSGAGWGGVMFALVKKGDEQKVAKAIESTGAEAIITTIGGAGAKCE
jgi:mevalonate kinase